MAKLETLTKQTKHCPRCNLDLHPNEFGISRRRPSGLNTYCKRCNRFKTNTSRKAARERKAQVRDRISRLRKPESAPPMAAMTAKRQTIFLSPTEAVRKALAEGDLTQRQLLETTKVTKEDLGLALADLLLWERSIQTYWIGEQRMYGLRKVA